MYQTKGLAEIVRSPSPITMRYLNVWFTSSGSFGKGLKIISWPIVKDNSPLLVKSKDGKLLVDLKVEEKVMYSSTVLQYFKKGNDYELAINLKNLLSPIKVIGTIRALMSQAKLLINYKKTYNLAKSFVQNIPIEIPNQKSEIEDIISQKVWPNVIAVDYIGEFIYSALTNKLNYIQKSELINKLHKRISSRDWYTKSILAWNRVQENKTLVGSFVKEFGFSSTNEYELTTPRFYELLNRPKPEINKMGIEDMKVSTLEDLYVGMQYLRSEAKRKSLFWISALRDIL